MKQVIAYILISLLTLQSFSPLVIFSAYYANKSFVAGVLCENKNKPRLHCDGKCFLSKQLQKAEKEEHSQNTPAKAIEAFVYTEQVSLHNISNELYPAQPNYPLYQPNHYNFYFEGSCFRPPSA